MTAGRTPEDAVERAEQFLRIGTQGSVGYQDLARDVVALAASLQAAEEEAAFFHQQYEAMKAAHGRLEARLQAAEEALRISYPRTPVDALLSNLDGALMFDGDDLREGVVAAMTELRAALGSVGTE